MGLIEELGFIDMDEIYSESDASDYRDEDVQITLDNKI